MSFLSKTVMTICRKKKFSETEADSLIEKAAAEGAYITTNHPGWPDKNSELPAYIVRHIEQKRIQGIEIFNNEEFYPRAIDYADQYNLAYIGATDAHYPMDFLFDLKKKFRTLTFVLQKKIRQKALRRPFMRVVQSPMLIRNWQEKRTC